jgi:hypothetical protein
LVALLTSPWYGVKNDFGISVYSKEYTFPTLVVNDIKYRSQLSPAKFNWNAFSARLVYNKKGNII